MPRASFQRAIIAAGGAGNEDRLSGRNTTRFGERFE
jgi:hypothetical protein